MAKKSTDSDFSKSKNLRDLDEALGKSFTNIKNDMTALKEGQHQHGIKIAEIGQDFKDSRADFVTLDKFNIIKIKIGELNETLKKLWDIEKKVDDVDRKSVSSAEFDKHSVATDNELAKLKEDVKDLNESVTTDEQTKALVKDINSEFDAIKKGMDELRNIKDTITRAELEKRTDKQDKKLDKFEEGIDKLKADMKTKLSATQAEELVGDINSEFDKIKHMISQIKEGEDAFALENEVEKNLAKLDKKIDDAMKNTTIAIDEFSKGIESALKDMSKANEKSHDYLSKQTDKVEDKISREISKREEKLSKRIVELATKVSEENSSVRKKLKTLVTRKSTEKLVGDINKEFDMVKDDVEANSKDISKLSKESATKRALADEVAKLKKGLAVMTADLSALRKDAAMESDTKNLFDELRDKIGDTNKAIKQKFDELVNRIKKDGDVTTKNIKSNSQDLNTFAKGIKKELKPLVSEQDLHDELDVVRDEFERLHKDIKSVKDTMLEDADLDEVSRTLKKHMVSTKKDYVKNKKFEKLMNAVGKLNEQLDQQNDMISEKNKQMKDLLTELKKARKAQKKLAKYESVVVSAGDRKTSKKAKSSKSGNAAGKKVRKDIIPYRKSSFLANFLIGAAFVVLVLAVVFFFTGLTGLTDMLAISAVVCFVVGVVIRIIVGFKRNGD